MRSLVFRLLARFLFWRSGRKAQEVVHACGVCYDNEAPFLPLMLNCCPDCKTPICQTDWSPESRRCLRCERNWWGQGN